MIHFYMIPLMSAMGRLHGIGGVTAGRIVSKIAFVLIFGIGVYTLYGLWYTPLAVLSAIGLSIGHGEFYGMGGANPDPEMESWEKYPRRFWNWLGHSEYTEAYSLYMMALKGLMVGSPLGVYGLPLGIVWPLAYYVSFRYTKSSALAEYLSAGSAGLLISCL